MNQNKVASVGSTLPRGVQASRKTLSMLAIAILLVGAGCVSEPAVDSDWIRKANANFESKDGAMTHSAESDTQLARLWSDKPENVELLRRVHLRNIRVVSGVVPRCPPDAVAGTHFPVRVQVSFLVGADGKVKDARIFESYDPRFDSISLSTIRKFRFLPARGADGRPEPEMTTLPFVFFSPVRGTG
jgi:TonB family protein